MYIHISITLSAALWQWNMTRGKLSKIWKLVSTSITGREGICKREYCQYCTAGSGEILYSYQCKLLTGWSVLLIPIRKSSSATKRLMQRFLWMVLRSLWSPRKKQNVKMQIRRQTRESKIPTHVITSRRRSWTASLCWEHNRKVVSCKYA